MKLLAPICFAVGAALTACHSVTEPARSPLLLAKVDAAPTIMTTDLGTLGPGPGFCLFPSSQALDINARGLIVGWSDSGCTRMKGFMWDNGTMTDLGSFGAVAVNNHDQIAGNLLTAPFVTRAALWQDGMQTDLGTLGGEWSEARTLNEGGEVVGRSATATGATHAFSWQDGMMTDLGTLGGSSSEAIAVNPRGQIVGNSVTATGATHAFLWQDGAMTDLGTLGGDVSEVRAVNERGQMVGSSRTATGETHAFLWQDGAMTDLGTLGGPSSRAHAVNSPGQIAGLSSTPSGETHVFLWKDGVMTDLGTPEPSRGEFVGNLRLNDRGQIVGTIRTIASLPGGFTYLWQGGAAIKFAGPGAQTVALNNHDEIVGWVIVGAGPVRHATLWTVEPPDNQNEPVAAGAAGVSGSPAGSS